jgi:hypothetical protein
MTMHRMHGLFDSRMRAGASMTTMTLDDVSNWTQRESLYWNVAAIMRIARRRLLLLLIVIPLLPPVLVLAQVFPFRILSCTRRLSAALPDVTDVRVLELVYDMLRLVHNSGSFYSRFCVFRVQLHQAMDEVSELIDSLRVVISSQAELNNLLETGTRNAAPDLPLQFDRVAHG